MKGIMTFVGGFFFGCPNWLLVGYVFDVVDPVCDAVLL